MDLHDENATRSAKGVMQVALLKTVPLLRMAVVLPTILSGASPRVSEPVEGEFEDAASLAKLITELEKRMRTAAKTLEFEEAAGLRDRIKELRRQQIFKT